MSDLKMPLLTDAAGWQQGEDAAGSRQGDDAAAGDGTQTNVTGPEPTSYKEALRAGSMLGQMCERSLIEHQLAASHFAVLNFCEHAPGHRTQRAIALHTESDVCVRRSFTPRGVLPPLKPTYRHRICLGVRGRP